MTNLFGVFTSSYEVEIAVLDHLKLWSLTYLAEVERRTGRAPRALPAVRSWTTSPREPDKWAEDQVPAILVVSPGLQGEPYEDGEGQVVAEWQIVVGAIAEAASERATVELAHLYYKHAQLALLQHSDLGGFAEDIEWRGDSYDVLPVESRRSRVGVLGIFTVRVSEVADVMGGPLEPLDDPYVDPGDWPVATDVEVTINDQQTTEESS